MKEFENAAKRVGIYTEKTYQVVLVFMQARWADMLSVAVQTHLTPTGTLEGKKDKQYQQVQNSERGFWG